MDTKYINDFFNNNVDKIDKLAEDVVDQLNLLLDDFVFIDNDDLRLIHARISQKFIANFNYEFGGVGLFKKMKK